MKKNVEKQPINFEDILFIVHTRIQMLHDVLALDVPSDLFMEKTVGDMEFIDNILAVLLKELTEDTYIAERDEQLDNISETEWQFSQILTRFLSVSGNISVIHAPSFKEKIIALRNQTTSRRKTADDSRTKTESAILEPVVSSDEMAELLKGF
jgi:hypothetical protein